MTFAATHLVAAVGGRSGSKPGANRPEDVAKVQALLLKVLGSSAPRFSPLKCDQAMVSAIMEFQRMWGAADGVIDPGGLSLKRLDRLVNPLTIEKLEPGRISRGGYDIAVRTCDGGPLPPEAAKFKLFLSIGNDSRDCLDLTGRPLNDLMAPDHFGKLLFILERIHRWGQNVECSIQLRRHGQTVSSSRATMKAPVQPHNGILTPLDEINNGPKLPYVRDYPLFTGRMLEKVAGYSKFIFKYAAKPEISNRHRGFDCITYVGAVLGVPTTKPEYAENAEAPFQYLKSVGKAEICVLDVETEDPKTGRKVVERLRLEKAKAAYVKSFFERKTSAKGDFILWQSGHVVLVRDGVVHEFSEKKKGYYVSAIGDWLKEYHNVRLSVCRVHSTALTS